MEPRSAATAFQSGLMCERRGACISPAAATIVPAAIMQAAIAQIRVQVRAVAIDRPVTRTNAETGPRARACRRPQSAFAAGADEGHVILSCVLDRVQSAVQILIRTARAAEQSMEFRQIM